MPSHRLLLSVCAASLLSLTIAAGQPPSLVGDVVDATTFRNIGPFRTSAWVTEIAVPHDGREHLYTIYAATRSGGLWKTVNNGVTWTPISDSVDAAAVGAVAVAPSDADVVWMGTGDQANARSSYSGTGLYKSTDAGRTWQHAGLRDSHHIARIVIHPSNPEIVYVAAMGHLFSRNEERGVFRTRNGGRTWEKVLYVDDGTGAIDLVMDRRSPDVLYAATYESRDGGRTWNCDFMRGVFGDFRTIWWDEQDPQRIMLGSDGGVNVSYDGGRTADVLPEHTSISESPLSPGVIWVGTDDGRVHLTRDHGGSWTEMTAAMAAAGGPADRYVSRVFASPHDAGTAFVARNGFRNDDFRPFLSRTTDYGRTWTDIAAGLPASPINVVVQDRRNPALLIVGNDLGVWISLDAGAGWMRLKGNLPTVAVHDLTVHPRENDLVLGTYGRGISVGDIRHLQELGPAVTERPLHLFEIEPRAVYQFRALGNFHLYGDAFIEVPNEPDALVINYLVRDGSEAAAAVTVTDIAGETIATLKGPAERGMNTVLWNKRRSRAGEPGGSGAGARAPGPLVRVGDYRVTLTVGSAVQVTIARVRARLISG